MSKHWKSTLLGIVLGVAATLAAGVVLGPGSRRDKPPLSDTDVNEKASALPKAEITGEPVADSRTLQQIRQINRSLAEALAGQGKRNDEWLGRVLAEIPVRKARDVGKDEILLYVSLIEEIGIYGFLRQSTDIVAMCDDRMQALARAGGHEGLIAETHGRLKKMQALLKQIRFSASIDTAH